MSKNYYYIIVERLLNVFVDSFFQFEMIFFRNGREKSRTMVIDGDVIFHQTYNEYTDWNKVVKQTTILKGNRPMKTEAEYSYTLDGHLKSCSETGSLSWDYVHDENGNIVNANFGIGNITNEYDER